MTPTTWEQGAEQATERILSEFSTFPFTWEGVADTAVLKGIDWDIDNLRAMFGGDEVASNNARRTIRSLANEALELEWRITPDSWDREDRRAEMRKLAFDTAALAANKQADYGCGNIDAFGMDGVIVRLSDKVARLRNLWGNVYAAQNESLTDTLVDIFGYAVISEMLGTGTFHLPLERDLPVEELKGQTDPSYTGPQFRLTEEAWLGVLAELANDLFGTSAKLKPETTISTSWGTVPVFLDPDVPKDTLYFLDPSQLNLSPVDAAILDLFGGTQLTQRSIFEELGGTLVNL